jgi:tetraacyldisaccharide 4'-kinase
MRLRGYYLGLFELLYFLGHKIKTARDLRRQNKLPGRVISVGNITVGGTGKTPLTMALALEAKTRGFNPVILTRGYKGRAKGPVLVSGEMSAGEVGDEPLLMAKKLPGIPVIKCADRYEGGMYALSKDEIKKDGSAPPLFILDDGFQHRKLYRDVDILLVNALDPFGGKKLLPIGHLREPLSGMMRADVIVVTNGIGLPGDIIEGIEGEIRRHNRQAPIFIAGRRPARVKSGGEELPVEWLTGKSVYAFCGIGEPESFRADLAVSGARVLKFRAYGDHYRYGKRDLEMIIREAYGLGAEWIITTEKDIMRIGGGELPDSLLTLAMEIMVDADFYDNVFGERSGG